MNNFQHCYLVRLFLIANEDITNVVESLTWMLQTFHLFMAGFIDYDNFEVDSIQQIPNSEQTIIMPFLHSHDYL